MVFEAHIHFLNQGKGSVLGPTLFVLYINDGVREVSVLLKLVFFADNTNIFCSGENLLQQEMVCMDTDREINHQFLS